MLKLVEQRSGIGELLREGHVVRQVTYRIDRYQGVMDDSGLPIPGLHRIEGSVELDAVDLGRAGLTLRLENGQIFKVALAGREGRILSEGHGPGVCLCC